MEDRHAALVFCRYFPVSSFLPFGVHRSLTLFHSYVAMHTMQDNVTESTRHDSNTNGYLEGREPSQPNKSMRDLIASVVGMVMPLFLQIGHSH